MPYIKKDEKATDKNGVEIKIGDILYDPDNAPWEYFLVEKGYDDMYAEIRDLSAHNVCMGEVENMTNLGNWKNHKEILDKYNSWDETLKEFETEDLENDS